MHDVDDHNTDKLHCSETRTSLQELHPCFLVVDRHHLSHVGCYETAVGVAALEAECK